MPSRKTKANAPPGLPKPNANKFDPSEQYRHEIEARTAAGETCEQIATALATQGVDISKKTISRRRVEWGLRRRPPHKYSGQKLPKPRPRREGTSAAKKDERKAEIEMRTQRGETAEEIAEALQAEGVELKRGAATVLRLQTFWGLIPYDEGRARGRLAKKQKETREKEKVSKREREREANRAQREGNQYYPADCSFGPKKRAHGASGAEGEEEDVDAGMDGGEMPPYMDNPMLPSPRGLPTPSQNGVNVAQEIMSVDFLVDLANSTLGAANNLKAMLLAYQAGVPMQSSDSMLPPTLEDLSTARRKVREAAAVMHDLAVEPTGANGAT